MFEIAQPWWLLPGVLYPVLLWFIGPRSTDPHPHVQSRRRRALLLHGLSVLTLVFAAAGLQLSLTQPHRQIVVAADVSDSVFDLPTQDARLRQFLSALNPDETDVAFTVFGQNAGVEAPLRALPPLRSGPGATPERRPRESGLPSVAKPTSLVERGASDVGAAIQTARGLFDTRQSSARAILLLSDFRDTAGHARTAAAALNGSGIALLTAPVLLGPSADVCLAGLELPASAAVGRSLPIEVTLTAQAPATVRVSVWRRQTGGEETPVGFKTITLEAPPAGVSERRVAVRFLDTPAVAGIAQYAARVSGADGELPGDILTNNTLAAAVRVQGPSHWAVLAKSDSTLANLTRQPNNALGAKTTLFSPGAFPTTSGAYAPFSGILVDGLSKLDLPEGPALLALSEAVESGKALLALGGESAFGNGGHREGGFERLLPVEMTPEDDRTRSILFVIDVSSSMNDTIRRGGVGVTKKAFAEEQLAQAVQKLKSKDRLGLIEFSSSARLSAPLSNEPSRAAFLAAVRGMQIEANTDLLKALKIARETLEKDDAEEQLVVLLSDGVQTASASADEIVAEAKRLGATPGNGERRATLFTFGIGVDAADANPAGEALLKRLAETGGGTYSPQFLKLAERLEKAFEGRQKDFFVRREPFGLRAAYAHPLLDGEGWPALSFRNRVKPKPYAETLLWSAQADGGTTRRPDPLLILSGAQAPGLSRRVVLALGLDGESGARWLAAPTSQRLLPSLLAWAEGRADAGGAWSLLLEDGAHIKLRAIGRAPEGPLNGRNLRAQLQPADASGAQSALTTALLATGPGEYLGGIPESPQGVYRVTLKDGESTLLERLITLPYPSEVRSFGVDRAAMQEWVAQAGGSSRAIESPRDLELWAQEQSSTPGARDLGSSLLVLALVLILAQVYVRSR